MKATWADDPQRLGRCWDLRNERGELLAYVLGSGRRYVAASYHLSFRTRWFTTKEEAVAYIDAILALES